MRFRLSLLLLAGLTMATTATSVLAQAAEKPRRPVAAAPT